MLKSVALPYRESYHMRDGRNFRAKAWDNSLPQGSALCAIRMRLVCPPKNGLILMLRRA
jgi:hypothetical protein